jgi:thioredoxin reductase
MKSQDRCARNSEEDDMYDAIVIGGGPAGLQAALTLGRMHRRALLVDSGEYRNGTVPHAHNLITHDGRDPADLRRLAHAELAGSDSIVRRRGVVEDVAPAAGGFSVRIDGEEVATQAVLLATGLRDELPPIAGLAEHWGDRVANCPFCHGHEFAGRRVAILNAGEHAAMLAAMLAPVAAEVVVVDPARVAAVEEIGDELLLRLEDGTIEAVAGAFVAPRSTQRAPFAERLGLALQDSGAVRVDPFGRTSVPDVYAAGDMAHPDALPGPLASLAAATAAGQLAAVAIVQRAAARTL